MRIGEANSIGGIVTSGAVGLSVATALIRFPSVAPGSSSQAAASGLSAEIDAAFNLKPPPLGPWFPK